MNVIPEADHARHLLAWVNAEAAILGSKTPHYSLSAALNSGDLATILKAVDQCYFGSLGRRAEAIEDVYAPIEQFITKECQKRVRLPFKNKVLKNFQMEALISLALFVCLHSKKKSEFISRVMELPETTQSALMGIFQEVSAHTESIIEIKEILLRVEELENEVENLKKQLGTTSSLEEAHRMAIFELEDDLNKSQKDIRSFKQEKQIAIETLKLSSFDEYLVSFQKLQQENTLLNKYVQQLEQSNEEHETSQRDLKSCIKSQLQVISQLNDEITLMKERYSFLKLEKLNMESEETIDATGRSFGTDLLNIDKENLDISHIERKTKSARFPDLSDWLGEEEGKGILQEPQEGLLSETERLRRYNGELMQKLDGVYQTVQSLTEDGSRMRQKNRNLKKENKFYKKQIEDLRKLHNRFEKQYFGGKL